MKNVLLIGLGRFGRHMAQTLSDLHHQVLVIDKDEHKVQEAMSYVTNAEIGDATDPALIDALGVKDFDLCVVTMSHDLQASLEITALLKKKGAPFVLVRVSRDTHAQFLLSCLSWYAYPGIHMLSFCFPAGLMRLSIRKSKWRIGLLCDTVTTIYMTIPACLPITPFMKQRSLIPGLGIP